MIFFITIRFYYIYRVVLYIGRIGEAHERADEFLIVISRDEERNIYRMCVCIEDLYASSFQRFFYYK